MPPQKRLTRPSQRATAAAQAAAEAAAAKPKKKPKARIVEKKQADAEPCAPTPNKGVVGSHDVPTNQGEDRSEQSMSKSARKKVAAKQVLAEAEEKLVAETEARVAVEAQLKATMAELKTARSKGGKPRPSKKWDVAQAQLNALLQAQLGSNRPSVSWSRGHF
jgi:hypothetical protein